MERVTRIPSPSPQTWEGLLDVLVRGRVLDADAAAQALTDSGNTTSQSSLFLEAWQMRLVLEDTLGTVARGDDLSGAQIDALNQVLTPQRERIRLDAGRRHLSWRAHADDPVAGALAGIAWRAAELLTDETECSRLRRCDGCGRFFLDRTRNRSRRWCEMRGCGNRAKARRYYERKRSGRVGRDPEWQADGVP